MTAHTPAQRFRCLARSLVAALATLMPAVGHACGACDEDKVAATYDHRVVKQAAASGDVMVFCAVTGAFDGHHLSAAARRVHGIRVASVRSSANPAALSFAVDVREQSPQAAVEATQRRLAPGTRLTIVRVLESPAGMR